MGMRTRGSAWIVASAAIGATAIALAHPANAADETAPAPCAPCSAEPEHHVHPILRTGTEMLARFSVAFQDPVAPVRFAPGPGSAFATQPGGIYEGSEAPFKGAATTAIGFGYRFRRDISIGLGGSFATFVTSAVSDGSSNLTRTALGIAPYARYYAPLGDSFEIWGSLGVGLRTDTTKYARMTAAGGKVAQGNWELDYEGIQIPIGVGIDYHPFHWLFFGPSLQYVGVIALKGCLKIDAPTLQKEWCTDSDPSVTRAYSYQVVSVGLSLRARLF
jgi:hypothetical protein